MAQRGTLRVGTAGYRYANWAGVFYPRDLPKKRWLEHYATRFAALEVNSTFYGLPAARTVDAWREAVPDSFRFCPKLSRYATHIKRLREPERSQPAFFEAIERLSSQCGPVLAQLPPGWRPVPERLDAFLAAAPAYVDWAVEVREASWLADPVFAVLEKRRAALCVHDLIAEHPRRATAGFVYLRLHGGPEYDRPYSNAALDDWAGWLDEELAAGRDAWVFFNNTAGAHAPRDAERLLERLAVR